MQDDDIAKKRDLRLAILREVYRKSHGDPNEGVYSGSLTRLAYAAGLMSRDATAAVNHLVATKHLRRGKDEDEVFLGPAGLKALEGDGESTAGAITFNISGSNNTVGAIGGRDAFGSVTISNDVRANLQSLRIAAEQLPAAKRAEAIELVDELEEQATVKRPREMVLRSVAERLQTYLAAYGPVIATVVQLILERAPK